MNNLKLSGVHELDTKELGEISGGFIWPILVEAAIFLLIGEWESTKQAAVDAWNGIYNPPA